MRVRCFGPAGETRRALLLDQLLLLEAAKRVVLVRNSRGVVTSAHFYGESRLPVRSRFKPGTRYSFREPLASGRPWTHAKLPNGGARDGDDAESLVRGIFLGVALSCSRH